MIACGTAVTVIPIRSIVCKSRGDRFAYLDDKTTQPGVCAAMVASALGDIQKGKAVDPFDWLADVSEPVVDTESE